MNREEIEEKLFHLEMSLSVLENHDAYNKQLEEEKESLRQAIRELESQLED